MEFCLIRSMRSPSDAVGGIVGPLVGRLLRSCCFAEEQAEGARQPLARLVPGSSPPCSVLSIRLLSGVLAAEERILAFF